MTDGILEILLKILLISILVNFIEIVEYYKAGSK